MYVIYFKRVRKSISIPKTKVVIQGYNFNIGLMQIDIPKYLPDDYMLIALHFRQCR